MANRCGLRRSGAFFFFVNQGPQDETFRQVSKLKYFLQGNAFFWSLIVFVFLFCILYTHIVNYFVFLSNK